MSDVISDKGKECAGCMCEFSSYAVPPCSYCKRGWATAFEDHFKWAEDLEGEGRMIREGDPTGRSAKEAGAKLDYGKVRPELVMRGFSRAILEVARVGTFGADKYSDDGWITVPEGRKRYTDAMYRHLLKEHTGECSDPESGLFHAAHAAWNALARLELMLRDIEEVDTTTFTERLT